MNSSQWNPDRSKKGFEVIRRHIWKKLSVKWFQWLRRQGRFEGLVDEYVMKTAFTKIE